MLFGRRNNLITYRSICHELGDVNEFRELQCIVFPEARKGIRNSCHSVKPKDDCKATNRPPSPWMGEGWGEGEIHAIGTHRPSPPTPPPPRAWALPQPHRVPR